MTADRCLDGRRLRELVTTCGYADLYCTEGASLYASVTRADRTEVQLVRRAARATTGTIVELACGDGRLTVPLLGLGRRVVAVDRSSEMLAMLIARAASVGASERLRVIEADLGHWTADEPIGLALLATTSVTLLPPSAREHLFANIASALHPEGLFMVSTLEQRIPPDIARGDAGAEASCVPVPGDPSGRRVLMFELPDWTPSTRLTGFVVTDGDDDTLHQPRLYASEVQRLPAATLIDELERAGFEITGCEGRALAAGHEQVVVTARPRP
jgi:methylation protein MtfA